MITAGLHFAALLTSSITARLSPSWSDSLAHRHPSRPGSHCFAWRPTTLASTVVGSISASNAPHRRMPGQVVGRAPRRTSAIPFDVGRTLSQGPGQLTGSPRRSSGRMRGVAAPLPATRCDKRRIRPPCPCRTSSRLLEERHSAAWRDRAVASSTAGQPTRDEIGRRSQQGLE
jgi:hypothetical protein